MPDVLTAYVMTQKKPTNILHHGLNFKEENVNL